MSRLQKTTVVLDVNFHTPNAARPASLSDVDVDADADSLKMSKEIFRSPYYNKTASIRTTVRKKLARYALPSPFKNGTYLMPVDCLEDCYEILEKAKEEYDEAAKQLSKDWPAIKEDAKKRLRSQFDERQFPSVERIRRAFGLDWQLLEFQTPDNATLGEVLYEKELKKAKAKWEVAEGQVSVALQVGLSKLITHLLSQLKESPDGTKSKLHPRAVEKVKEFLDLFSKRNVLKDRELAALATKAQDILDGKDASDLRVSDVKAKVTKELSEVSKGLERLVTKTKRKFSFDE